MASLFSNTADEMHIAAGGLEHGLSRFRTSHLEETRVAEFLSSTTPARPELSAAGSLTVYADVELVVLLAKDADLCRNFVLPELGALAADTSAARELRVTVAAYLSCDRSLIRAADHLHVARKTVAYRVKKFETLAARDLKDRRLELEAGLRLAARLGGTVLQ